MTTADVCAIPQGRNNGDMGDFIQTYFTASKTLFTDVTTSENCGGVSA